MSKQVSGVSVLRGVAAAFCVFFTLACTTEEDRPGPGSGTGTPNGPPNLFPTFGGGEDASIPEPPTPDRPTSPNDAGVDAGEVHFEPPVETPTYEPPEPGDELEGEGEASLGEVDVGLGFAFACLHVDLERGEFIAVPDDETPEARFEPVLNFGKEERGFAVFSIAPWMYDWVEPEEAPETVETGEQLIVSPYREGARLEVMFELRDDGVAVEAVEVVELELPPREGEEGSTEDGDEGP